MNLRVRYCTEADRSAWDAFVDKTPEATFFHRFGWRRVLREAFGHQPHFLLAEQINELEGLLVEPAEALWLGHVRGTIAAYRGEDMEPLARRFHEESRLVDDPQYRATGAELLLIQLLVNGRSADAQEFEGVFTSALDSF